MNRRPPVRRSLAAVALVPLLLSGVAACGSDDSGSEGKDTAAGSAVLAGLHPGDQVDPGDFVDTVADGVQASTTAHMTMNIKLGDMGEMGGEGDLDYTADPPEVAMTMDAPMMGGATKLEVRYVGGIFYMSMGNLTGGKFWKIDPSDPNSPLGEVGDMMDQMDPMGTLQKLEPAIDRVTYVGNEDVDGRSLDHYELTVEPAQVAKSMDLPADARKQMPDELTYDIWLDDQNRLSKMTMDMPAGGMGDASVELTATDWGEDVSIEAPPADQITEMPDMGSMMDSSSGA